MQVDIKAPLISPSNKRPATQDRSHALDFSELLESTLNSAFASTFTTLSGHTGSVNSVCISSDHQFIASASEDCSVKLWSVHTLSELHTFLGHTDEVWTVTFSQSKNFLVSGSKDTTVIVWNTFTLLTEFSFKGHSEGVNVVLFSHSEQFLFSGSEDFSIKVWNFENKAQEFELLGHGKGVKALAFSHNSQFIASGSTDRCIKLWDFNEQSEVFTLECSGEVNALVISLSDNFIISGTDDGKVVIWSLETRTEDFIFSCHSEPVYSISLSTDGRTLVTGSADLLIKVLDLENRVEKFTLANDDSINSIQLSPNNQFIVTGSADNNIKIWPLGQKHEIATLDSKNGQINALCSTFNGNYLISASDECEIVVWDLKTLHEEFRLTGHAGSVTCVLITSDDKWVVSGSTDEMVKIWNFVDRSEEFTLNGHSSGICCLALSGSNALLAVGGEDGGVAVWELDSQVKIWSREDCFNRCQTLVFAFDESLLFTVNEENKILGLGTVNKKVEVELSGHKSLVLSVVRVAKGKFLLSSDQEGVIKLWSLWKKTEEMEFLGHSGPVHSLDILNNRTWFVSGSSDKSVKVWNLSEKREEFTFEDLPDYVTSVKFIGDKIAAGCSDGCIKLWEIKEKSEDFCLAGHSGGVSQVVLSPDNKYCVTGSKDSTVKVWNIEEEIEECNLAENIGAVTKLAFAPSGTLVAASAESTIKVWNFLEKCEIFSFDSVSPCFALCFSPNSKVLIYVYEQSKVKIFEFEENSERTVLAKENIKILAMEFSPDGTILATGGVGLHVNLWNFPSFVLSFSVSVSSKVFDLKFAPNGAFFVTAGLDEYIKVWNFFGRREEFSLFADGTVCCVNFSADGKYLVSGGQDCRVRVWNLKEKREEFSIAGHKKKVNSVVVMKNARFVVSAADDGLVKGWKMQSWVSSEWKVLKSENEDYELTVSAFNTFEVIKSEKKEKVQRILLRDMKKNEITMKIKENEHRFVLDHRFLLSPVLQNLKKIALSENMVKVFKKGSNLNLVFWGPEAILDSYFYPKAIFLNFLYCLRTNNFCNFNAKGLNLQFSSFLYTPLHIWAFLGKCEELKKFLLNSKTTYLKADVFGRSPIHYSIQKHHQKCTDTLLQFIISLNESSPIFLPTLYSIRKEITELIENSSKFLPHLIQKTFLTKDLTIKKPLILPSLKFSNHCFPNPHQNQLSTIIEHSQIPIKYTPFKLDSAPFSTENIGFLKSINNSSNKKILETLLIRYLIDYNWEFVNTPIFLHSLCLLLNILTFLLVLQFGIWSYIYLILYILTLFTLFTWELIQLFTVGLYDYCSSTWNLLEWLKFSSSSYFIIARFYSIETEYEATTTAFFTLLTAVQSLSLFQGPRSYLQLLLIALSPFANFMLLLILSTLFFVILFKVSLSEPFDPETLWSDFFSFNFRFDMNTEKLWLSSLILFTGTIINAFLILTLLISVLGDSFEQFQVNKVYLEYKEKLRLCIRMQQSLYWNRPVRSLKYFRVVEQEEEDEWKGRIEHLDKIAERRGKVMEEVVGKGVKEGKEKADEKFEELQERIVGIEGGMCVIQGKIEGIEGSLKKALELLVKSKN